MKKSFFSLLLCVCMFATMFVGCGSNNNDNIETHSDVDKNVVDNVISETDDKSQKTILDDLYAGCINGEYTTKEDVVAWLNDNGMVANNGSGGYCLTGDVGQWTMTQKGIDFLGNPAKISFSYWSIPDEQAVTEYLKESRDSFKDAEVLEGTSYAIAKMVITISLKEGVDVTEAWEDVDNYLRTLYPVADDEIEPSKLIDAKAGCRYAIPNGKNIRYTCSTGGLIIDYRLDSDGYIVIEIF